MWRGDALDELAGETWAVPHVTRLHELRSHAVEELTTRSSTTGAKPRRSATIETHIGSHPYEDRPRALLLRALAAAGRQPEALRAFQSYRRLLAEEVGTEPSEALREVERRILDGWDGRRDQVRPVERRRVALPTPATSWVGPTHHLRRTAKDLLVHRVMTLTGPGGVGKTRTAIEISRLAADRFPDGVHLVELAALARGDDVPAAVVTSLAIQPEQGSRHRTPSPAGSPSARHSSCSTTASTSSTASRRS